MKSLKKKKIIRVNGFLMLLYKNRVVVVTGGNGNMGRAIIKKFKSYGAKCFAIDLKGNSNVIKCNLTNEKELKTVFENISKFN